MKIELSRGEATRRRGAGSRKKTAKEFLMMFGSGALDRKRPSNAAAPSQHIESGKERRKKASVVMQRLSYPTETVLSNEAGKEVEVTCSKCPELTLF